jgi:hypothetical protein
MEDVLLLSKQRTTMQQISGIGACFSANESFTEFITKTANIINVKSVTF